MTPLLTFNDLNTRTKEFIRVGTSTTVFVTVPVGELWNVYGIQDTDGSTNTFRIDYLPSGGAVTWSVFRQSTASNVPVGTSIMPPLRSGDTISIVGTVAANYLLMYQAVKIPTN